MRQQDRLVPQVARVPGTGPGAAAPTRSAAARSPALISTGQHLAAHPDEPAGDPGRDLPGLPGQLHRLVMVAGVHSGVSRGQPGPAAPRPGSRSPGPAPASGGHRSAASASRPMFSNATDRPARASASARDGPRSAAASRTAVKWPSAAARSAENSAAQPSQNCAAHHPSLPGSARPAACAAAVLAGSRPRSNHHQPSATASRSARAGSCPSPRPAPAAWWRPRRPASGPRPAHRAGLQPRRGLLGHPQRVPGQRGCGPVLLPAPASSPAP